MKLYSVPKHPEGISIEGMTGEVSKDVSQFKGKVLSANLPYLVKFKTSLNGADIKFQAHLVSFPEEGQQHRQLCPALFPYISFLMHGYQLAVLQGEEELAAA